MAMRPYPRVPLREGALHGDGALQRLRRRAERRHESVTHRLHLGAAVGGERLADDAFVLAQHLPRPGVAEALGEGGGAFDVREEDRIELGRWGFYVSMHRQFAELDNRVEDLRRRPSVPGHGCVAFE